MRSRSPGQTSRAFHPDLDSPVRKGPPRSAVSARILSPWVPAWFRSYVTALSSSASGAARRARRSVMRAMNHFFIGHIMFHRNFLSLDQSVYLLLGNFAPARRFLYPGIKNIDRGLEWGEVVDPIRVVIEKDAGLVDVGQLALQ